MVIVQFCGRLVRQYRACVVDSLGLGITCLIHSTMHPDLVSFAFYAIPIFHIIFNSLASSHFQQCYEQQKNTTS